MATKKTIKNKQIKIKPPVMFVLLGLLSLFSIIYLVIFSLTQKKVDPFSQEITSSSYSTIIEKGIDVSQWQGKINWKKVKKSGVDFAIIRTGFGSLNQIDQIDTYFFTNIEAATKANIKVGVYHYSHALTPEEAKGEAEFVLNLIDGYSLEYPIYLDMEDSEQASLSNEELTAIALAFLETIEEAGYTCGIYANKYWLSNKLDLTALKNYEIWIAHYIDYNDFESNYGVWQFSDEGSINGIDGPVDLNVAYKYYY